MAFLDFFGKKNVGEDLIKKVPFGLKLRLHPYRLAANKAESVVLYVNLKNLKEEVLLTSIVVEVPKNLGFDQTGISKIREIRIGEIKPKEEREIKVEIFGNPRTEEGEYEITVTAYCHYRNYGYVLNAEKKDIVLRAV